MPFNAKGEWVPENAGVASRVSDITSSNNPYILAARASGMESANKRGLLNSSMAAGAAEGAAINAALPIASQESQQITSHNLAHQQGGYDMDRQRLVTASADRNASLSAALETNRMYQAAFSDLANNKDVPAATRDAYIKHLMDTRSTGFDMVQQVYGIDLQWAGKSGAGTPSTAPSTPFLEPVMPAGLTKTQQEEWQREQAALRARAGAAYSPGGGILANAVM